MAEQPKKPQRNKKGSKKITLNHAKSWKDIVEDVDKRQVPISILQNIEVKLVDGTKIDIDVKKLIQEVNYIPHELIMHLQVRDMPCIGDFN